MVFKQSLFWPLCLWSSSEQVLLETRPEILASDVLVVPHHGSKTSSTMAFIEQVHPGIAIFTNGYRNHFKHPNMEVVSRYQQAGSKLYRSDIDGAVLLDFDAGGIAIAPWRKTIPRYWDETTKYLRTM